MCLRIYLDEIFPQANHFRAVRAPLVLGEIRWETRPRGGFIVRVTRYTERVQRCRSPQARGRENGADNPRAKLALASHTTGARRTSSTSRVFSAVPWRSVPPQARVGDGFHTKIAPWLGFMAYYPESHLKIQEPDAALTYIHMFFFPSYMFLYMFRISGSTYLVGSLCRRLPRDPAPLLGKDTSRLLSTLSRAHLMV